MEGCTFHAADEQCQAHRLYRIGTDGKEYAGKAPFLQRRQQDVVGDIQRRGEHSKTGARLERRTAEDTDGAVCAGFVEAFLALRVQFQTREIGAVVVEPPRRAVIRAARGAQRLLTESSAHQQPVDVASSAPDEIIFVAAEEEALRWPLLAQDVAVGEKATQGVQRMAQDDALYEGTSIGLREAVERESKQVQKAGCPGITLPCHR